MPKKAKKLPSDISQLARSIVEQATGEKLVPGPTPQKKRKRRKRSP